MSLIDFTQMITAEDKASKALIEAKAKASAMMQAKLSEVAHSLTGDVPQAERDSWATKAVAAHAVLAGTASAEQSAMLAAECSITQEDPADLAVSIVAKAGAYAGAAATMAGIRRTATVAINTATDVDGVNAALAQVTAGLTSLASQG